MKPRMLAGLSVVLFRGSIAARNLSAIEGGVAYVAARDIVDDVFGYIHSMVGNALEVFCHEN